MQAQPAGGNQKPWLEEIGEDQTNLQMFLYAQNCINYWK